MQARLRWPLKLVGTTAKGEDALRLIAATQPDLVLVDIQLQGEKTGIDIIRDLNEKNPLPAIIISSANDQATFAKAAKVYPSAFLVKPFDQSNLQASIEIAIHEFSNPKRKSDAPAADWKQADQITTDKIFLKSAGILTKVQISDVRYIEVKNKDCLIGLEDEVIKVRIPLHKMEEKLNSTDFIRCHRSFIVNAEHIKNINVSDNQIEVGKYFVSIGKLYKEEFLKKLDVF